MSSYTQTNPKSNTSNYSFSKNIKIEDEHGHLITDSIKRLEYIVKRQKKIELNKTKRIVNAQVLTPVPLCSNGSFEEFETISGTNILKSFQHIDSEPENPIQCKSVSEIANENIIQYDPTNFDIMATTVPSNFLDEYIGNINAFDQFALKINFKNSSETLSLIQAKRFKTDNETSLKFNYKAVLQSILGPDHDNEQPYFKARIINNSGVVVSEFCLIADPNNCIFTQASNLEANSIVMYTPNWQSGILDISSIPNNENFTIEFLTTRCGLGGHFGYSYIDDICLLHSNENLQGSITLDPMYKICPTLPLQVCGTFTIPNSGGIAATITSVELKIFDQNNTVVYTSQTPTILNTTSKTFCFDVVAANLPNITTGTYNTSVKINYGIVQTNCSGTNFLSATDDDANPGWDIWFLNCTSCTIPLQTASLTLCDGNKDGKEFFNLSNANALISTNLTGLTFSYFSSVLDATNNTNPIATFTNYESSTKSIFVRVEQSATCFKIIPINLVVKYPNATISGVLNICSGSTILTASPGISYLWGNGATTQSISVSNIGTYTVAVTDSFGCIANGFVTILSNLVAPQPNIVVTQPTCQTEKGSIQITSPASEYSFDNGATWVTTSTLNNLSIGDYVVKIKTASGCYSYATTISLVPFLSSFPDFNSIQPTFCGDKGSITITTVADQYSFDDGVTWTSSNTVNNLPSGIYKIRTKDAAGCISNYNSVTLNSEFLAPPLFTVDNPYCGNTGSITIDTPASEYSFDGGNTWQTSNILTGLVSDSYIIKIKDAQGCTSPTVYVYLTDLENSYPIYTIDEAGCNKYATITINTIADYYSFDGGLNWSTNNILANQDGGMSFQIKVRKGTSCDSYTGYAYTNSYFHPLPIVTDFSTLICDNQNNRNENTDLTNFNNHFIANFTNYSYEYYLTLIGAQHQSINDKITNPTSYNLNEVNKIIYVLVIDPFGCSSVAKLDLTLIDTPVPTLKDSYFLCKNLVTIVREDKVFDSYLWSTGETGKLIVVGQSGNYSLTVTENHNTPNGVITCSTTKNFTIILSDRAFITSIKTEDWTDVENTISINVNGLGAYEYSIDGDHYQESNFFSGLLNGEYNVYIRDKNGCGITKDEVFLLNYPKFFTPNGDGFNDSWKINFSEEEPELKIEIYDRTGKLLKSLDYKSSWDGMYNNKMMFADDYWFVVHRANGKEHRGHFTLKR